MMPIERRKLAADNIPVAISELGLGGESPLLETEHRGGQCHVFQLSFKDRESLAIRVPLYMPNDDAKIHALEQELKILHILEVKQFPWAPRYRGHSLTFDNPIKHPFVVLTWVAGAHLRWDDKFPPQPTRDRVLAQMATIQLSLIQCTLEAGGIPAAAFFERIMRNRRELVRGGKITGLSEKDCIDQERLLGTMLGENGLRDTAFAMDHGDFKPDNIIVDSQCNIKSVIDWAFAALVPIARAAGLPRFLWPSLSPHVPCPMAQRDRQVYAASLSAQTSQAAAYIRCWQGDKDAELRSLYLESLLSKGMHASLAQLGWKLPSGEQLPPGEEGKEA